MTCNSCGEPKKKDNSFTKAVIEINNPETLVLFRKVVIPASMGDETTVPPAVGKYYNVLLVYEANNNAYLYSSDGIPTLLTTDIAQDIERRVENLEEVDVSLQNQINLKANTADLSTVATSGNYADLTNTPTIGNATLTVQRNSTNVGTFTANSTSDTTIDISVPTSPADIGAQPLIDSSAKISADLVDDTSSTNKFVTAADLSAISTAVQPADINKTVMTDLAVDPTISTSTVQLNTTKENLSTGSSTAGTLTFPVASSTQAGIINSSTYDAIAGNSSDLNAIMNGAVAVTGLAASPSQSDITSAWMTETGLSTLINRASVYDVDNDKVWTYYTNDTTWHAASNTTQVTVNTFTNSSEGIIKGSTNAGQIFAESDGTGSVNGWDALNNTVSGKQDALTAGANISISSNTISATDTTYTAGTNVSISAQNVISATDTTYSNFVGATSGAAGTAGLVPAPASGETSKYLKSDGTWGDAATADTDLSLSSTNAIQNKTITRFSDILYGAGATELSTTGIDLNNPLYEKIGQYMCRTSATAATFLNCPTEVAFMMTVSSPANITYDDETTRTYVYRIRSITDIDGNMWVQSCAVRGTINTWSYGAWQKISNVNITMTSTDPGEGVPLAPNNFIAVYDAS